MTRTLITACSIALAICLAAGSARAQGSSGYPAALPPAVTPSHPTGFMIEGILAQPVYSPDWSTYPILNAPSVPNAIIGYKLEKVAIGLGVSLFRGYTSDENTSTDVTTKLHYTALVFMPRLEISIYRSKSGVAEVYLPIGFGMGFHHHKASYEGPGPDDDDKETDLMLGATAGLGARAFLGGSPFALGFEFGWSGSWYRIDDWYIFPDQTQWYGIHTIYGALTGVFVFD